MYKNGKPNYNEIVFTEQEKKDIIQSYMLGESSVKIGKRYSVGHKVILKLLHNNNINVSQSNHVRKYDLNETYFDIIDTANKAYILGLLWADGHNGLSKGTVTISLQEEDVFILEQMRRELCSNKPLEYLDYSDKHDFGYSYKNQYRLNVFSSHMCKSLYDLGMIPNKSLDLKFPNIEEKLLSHFIRGLFDGDGSIYRQVKNQNNHAVTITITSTNDMCKSLVEICKNILGFEPKIYDASCHNGETKVFTISGRNISKIFLDWIYKDAELYLPRKYNRYIEYYNINNSLSA